MGGAEHRGGDVAPDRIGAAALWLMAVLSVALAAVQLAHPSYAIPYGGLDEQGHYGYLDQLVLDGAWWPDFARMRLYGAPDTPNFINHPPLFYWLASPCRWAIDALGLPAAAIRLFTLALFATAAALYAVIGRRALTGALERCIFAALPFYAAVPMSAAFFNNDAAAVLGGVIGCSGALLWLRTEPACSAAWVLAAGMLLAAVKLTALLLVGGFVVIVVLAGWRRAPRRASDVAVLAAAALLALAPFAALWVMEGSPAPDTAGQTAMLLRVAEAKGWLSGPRIPLADYLAGAPGLFVEAIDGAGSGALALVVAALAASVLPVRDEGDHALALIARAAAVATLVTLAIHLGFSYRRHLAYGWLGDLYPRYYFPLVAAYGVAVALAARRLLVSARRAARRRRSAWRSAG